MKIVSVNVATVVENIDYDKLSCNKCENSKFDIKGHHCLFGVPNQVRLYITDCQYFEDKK